MKEFEKQPTMKVTDLQMPFYSLNFALDELFIMLFQEYHFFTCRYQAKILSQIKIVGMKLIFTEMNFYEF